jgi:RHS repeat-associated protein
MERPGSISISLNVEQGYMKEGLPYYPFGMVMAERNYSSSKYRYGYNKQERNDEVCGIGNILTAEHWEYDSRLGRRWNTDPLEFNNASESPFACFSNSPVNYFDEKGLEPTNNLGDKKPKDKNGHGRIMRKYDRRLKRWERHNSERLKGLRPDQLQDAFKAEHWDQKWFTRYERTRDFIALTTNQINTAPIQSNIIFDGDNNNKTSLNQVFPVASPTGQITLYYNMYGVADRIQIIDPGTGTIYYDSTTPVKYRKGSGVTINYSNPNGNATLQIIINPQPPPAGTYTFFRFRIESGNGSNLSDINHQEPSPNGTPKYNR